MDFILSAFLNRQSFLGLALVVAVYVDRKEIDVKPMSLPYTAKREKVDTELIYGVPYFRLQRGTSAVIMDPVVGDIGLIAVCDTDTSNIRATKEPAIPPTMRMHNLSDAIYLGGIGSLNKVPVQYVSFVDEGIFVNSHLKVDVTAPTVNVNATDTTVTTTKATVKASTIDMTGNTTINGNTKISGNLNVSQTTTTGSLSAGAGGGSSTFTGTINHYGTYNLYGSYYHMNGVMYSLGRRIDGNHAHEFSFDEGSTSGTTERPNP